MPSRSTGFRRRPPSLRRYSATTSTRTAFRRPRALPSSAAAGFPPKVLLVVAACLSTGSCPGCMQNHHHHHRGSAIRIAHTHQPMADSCSESDGALNSGLFRSPATMSWPTFLSRPATPTFLGSRRSCASLIPPRYYPRSPSPPPPHVRAHMHTHSHIWARRVTYLVLVAPPPHTLPYESRSNLTSHVVMSVLCFACWGSFCCLPPPSAPCVCVCGCDDRLADAAGDTPRALRILVQLGRQRNAL